MLNIAFGVALIIVGMMFLTLRDTIKHWADGWTMYICALVGFASSSFGILILIDAIATSQPF